MDIHQLLTNFLLFLFLPLWGIAGLLDWFCHRATNIEITSGLKESMMHSVMGIQVGIPILLCLLYRVNVLILLICGIVFLLHEIVAHWDVHYASPRRHISVWEMHAHNVLATLPLYMLTMIAVINWPTVIDLATLQWAGKMALEPRQSLPGGESYLPTYLTLMGIFCALPYAEENLRCLLQTLRPERVNP